jgi:hypothetical protein
MSISFSFFVCVCYQRVDQLQLAGVGGGKTPAVFLVHGSHPWCAALALVVGLGLFCALGPLVFFS